MVRLGRPHLHAPLDHNDIRHRSYITNIIVLCYISLLLMAARAGTEQLPRKIVQKVHTALNK